MIKSILHNTFIGVLISLFCFYQTASAQTIDPKTRGVLDFIGSIEGPAGYDDYYRGVSSGPPRPLSTMTVQQVLDWQDSVDATSKSEAAGRYQIMEDTLRGMVNSGKADPNARFDANTQDQLAAKLLRGRGWDPKRTDYVNMGNAIAYEWAALPRCSGMRKGRSAYDGIAGNSALTTCEAYLEILKNGDDPAAVAWALEQSVVGASGTGGTSRVNNAFDRFIKAYKNTFHDLSDTLLGTATSLLFSLLLIEWIWATGLQVSRGAGIADLMSAMVFRVLLGSAFLFIINLGNYSDLVIRSADGLLEQTSSGASINIIDLFDRISEAAFRLLGSEWYGWGGIDFDGIISKVAAIPVFLLGITLVGLIIIGYIETYLAFSAAVVALAFGGFTGTRHIAISYLKRCVGRVLRLFTALLTGAMASVLITQDLGNDASDPLILIGVLIILVFITLTVPTAVEQSVTGRTSTSPGQTLGKQTMSVLGNGLISMPKKLLRMIGVPFV